MRWIAVLSVALVLAGCDACGGQDSTSLSGDVEPVPSAQADRQGPGGEDPPGAVYQRAYRRAQEEITADNADDRLRQIEREVDREADPKR
jgi:hypothetical protein